MKQKFIWKKFIIFRLFRKLKPEERIHVMSVLMKKHNHQLEIEKKENE